MSTRIRVMFLCVLFLTGCNQSNPPGELHKAGLLVPETINDQVWGTKGYKGMLQIQSDFKVDVYYKEGMNTFAAAEMAVQEFKQKGVNLIFGHGNLFASYFNELSTSFENIHFVSFNGDANNTNTTSLNFEGYAMGFFGGMVAGHMSKTENVGVIAAYEWQPEVKGFVEGVQSENENVSVHVEFINDWDDSKKALKKLDYLMKKDVDIVYPAGDGYNVPVIEELKNNGLFAIGYVTDQSDLGETTVLTSTVQHVDKLYQLVATKFNEGTLEAGNLYFDFQDDVISLGTFSPLVEEDFIQEIKTLIQHYKKTGELPS